MSYQTNKAEQIYALLHFLFNIRMDYTVEPGLYAVGKPTYVSHKKLVLPQLGATGVSVHEVKNRSGYDIKYGPVRAEDIK